MADIGSDFDGPLVTDAPTRRLVAEVDDADWGCGDDIETVWLSIGRWTSPLSKCSIGAWRCGRDEPTG